MDRRPPGTTAHAGRTGRWCGGRPDGPAIDPSPEL